MKSSRPQWLQNVADYLLDNVFDIITIAVAAYVVIRHEFKPFGPNQIADLATWILAVLALIAVSGLWQHHRRLAVIEKLSRETHNLVVEHLGGEIRADHFFLPDDFKVTFQDFAQATDIYVVGMTLNRTVRDHMSAFGDRLAAGANLCFIILDPESTALMSVIPRRSYGSRSSEWWQGRIVQAENHIEDIPSFKAFTGTLKIGYLPYFPSFGMWLIDPDKPCGKIYVEVYHHKSPEMNPTFSLQAIGDPIWYGFFRKQFDLLWKSCEDEGRIREVTSLSNLASTES